MQRAAHSLKSGSTNLGATQLSAICTEWETIGCEARTKAAAPLMESLKAGYQQIVTALKVALEKPD
ncbi:hypothetical protein DJ030_02210 [bacterium endosymbiont of Escarpia laminata]|nr:MAG: hypothetical protein DJ031_17140 [bacterium endosymbiont of Escarpia laminata]RLJ22216.1 MAG: hypothetical protein DJ030_02210 [bacterium endosymbiont of Escarpia laminata]